MYATQSSAVQIAPNFPRVKAQIHSEGGTWGGVVVKALRY
jgi:hypothetical protein